MTRVLGISVFMVLVTSGQLAAQEKKVELKAVAPPAEDVIAQGTDMPSHFTPKWSEWEKPSADSHRCPRVYEDSRDGTTLKRIRMESRSITTDKPEGAVREEMAYADYWIDGKNRYDLPLGWALRIDCIKNTAVGVVERFPTAK